MKISLFGAAVALLIAGCQTTRPVITPRPEPTPLRSQPENYAYRPTRNRGPTEYELDSWTHW